MASVVLAVVAAVIAGGCGSSTQDAATKAATSAAPNAGATLTLVAYSTPREAFEKVIPAFQATPEGSGVEFEQSYGPSGDQSRAVEAGLAADLVDLSLEPDMTRLVDAGLVDADWSATEHRGMVSESVVVLAVRTGNPLGIKGWDDLIKKGVEVVTPNPFTSGGARWNLMAAYGAWTRAGDTPKVALGKLEQLLRNTPVQSKSAREALQVFAAGKGDVMLAYENEAITAQKAGEDIEYVIPDSTILIENPWAVTTNSKHPTAAKAFHDFALSEPAQRIFAKKGYRPVLDEVAKEFRFEQPDDLFTIADLGGWPSVMDGFFDRDTGKVAVINKRLGVPTDK